MKKDLVVITGGNSGLGLELTKLFSKRHNVLVIARTKRDELPNVLYEYGDISNEKFLNQLYSNLSENYNISYLINNAASGTFGSPETNTLKAINTVFSAGLVGLILNTTYAANLMKYKGGKIINILSSAALKGNVNESLYCAAKWGGRGFTESLKATYKGTNIKVVGVYPGGMNTAFWNNNRGYVSEEKSSKWMNPADVAKVIYDNVTNNKLCVADLVIERV